MHYVYVLFCAYSGSKKQIFYIGSTTDLRKRLVVHKSGGSRFTKDFDIIELVYYEACLNKTDARKRELQLKTGFGRGYLKRRLENYLKDSRV